MIKDRSPPLHKAPGGLSASPLQGSTTEGQATSCLTLRRPKQTTLPSPSANLWHGQETHTPFLFPSWPELNSEHPLVKAETIQQAKTRTDYQLGYCGLPLSENNCKQHSTGQSYPEEKVF